VTATLLPHSGHNFPLQTQLAYNKISSLIFCDVAKSHQPPRLYLICGLYNECFNLLEQQNKP